MHWLIWEIRAPLQLFSVIYWLGPKIVLSGQHCTTQTAETSARAKTPKLHLLHSALRTAEADMRDGGESRCSCVGCSSAGEVQCCGAVLHRGGGVHCTQRRRSVLCTLRRRGARRGFVQERVHFFRPFGRVHFPWVWASCCTPTKCFILPCNRSQSGHGREVFTQNRFQKLTKICYSITLLLPNKVLCISRPALVF